MKYLREKICEIKNIFIKCDIIVTIQVDDCEDKNIKNHLNKHTKYCIKKSTLSFSRILKFSDNFSNFSFRKNFIRTIKIIKI